MAASKAVAFKSDRKLLKLAMEGVDDFSCQKDFGCVRVLKKKHIHDLEEVKGDCGPERPCHLLWVVSEIRCALGHCAQSGSGPSKLLKTYAYAC